MKKNWGFSLVEITVVIVLMAILAAVSYPSFNNWKTKNAFEKSTNLFADSFDDVRANAISEKMCPSENPATEWKFRLTATEFFVDCLYTDGTDLGTATAQTDFDVFLPVGNDWGDSDQEPDLASSPLEISFFTDEEKLPEIKQDGTDFSQIKILFLADASATLSKKFCFNRIAGYFFWDDTGDCIFSSGA